VLPYLLEVLERPLLPLHHRAHSAQGGTLERLAAVERVSVLEKLDIVAADPVDQLLGEVELAEGELEVVAVVQHVDEVRVERMDVVQAREVGQDLSELVVVVHVRVLDLAHVKLPDADNVVAGVDHGRRLALRLGQDHIDEVLGRRHRLDLLKVVDDHGRCKERHRRP